MTRTTPRPPPTHRVWSTHYNKLSLAKRSIQLTAAQLVDDDFLFPLEAIDRYIDASFQVLKRAFVKKTDL
jgi:hypothetical protein